MKRSVAGVVGLVLIAAGLLIWRCAGGGGSAGPAAGGAGPTAGSAAGGPATAARKPRVDPSKLARGSFAGTITDGAGAPVPKARVCARGASDELPDELLRDPSCAPADDQGRYQIQNLLPARYTVTASARPFRPGVHRPGGDRRRDEVPLAAGEHRTGVDIALRSGGVEITGTVSDLTGGPIAGAKVRATGAGWERGGEAAHGEADEQGKFSLWVAPGSVWVSAAADGYAADSETGRAPGAFALLLTPESTLSGTVVDAETGGPVAGARVSLSSTEWFPGGGGGGGTTFTDEQGQFRIARVTPGRHVAEAHTDRGYGRTEGSTLVGLGQHVEGVVVKLFPAVRVEGKVILSTTRAPCEEGRVSLSDPARPDRDAGATIRAGGTLTIEGVRPGTYTPSVGCTGFQAREQYEPIVVADKDVAGLVWEVDPGATVRGKVLARSGDPIEGASVWARKTGGAARARGGFGADTSGPDGGYELTGLAPGAYELEVHTTRGVASEPPDQFEVAAGATVDKDLVLEDGGTIRGTVVDADGKPVAGVQIAARSTTGSMGRMFEGAPKSDEAGAFVIEGVRPGKYRVVAQRTWLEGLRRPGTTDDAKQGEPVTVRANQVAAVRLVIEAQTSSIRGVVIDAAGKPVDDAFVSAARESDAAGARPSSVLSTRWSWGERPVLTGLDGAFTVGKLSPGKYTVRAYRKGGGEAVAEHVPAGGTAKLQIKPTGSIEGTARRTGRPPEDLTVTVTEPATGFRRREQLYRTAGRYAVRDLPKGRYTVDIEAEGGRKQVEVDLGEGEARTGVDVELEALVDLTGRVVEHGTGKPVAGMRMSASPAGGGGGFRMRFTDDGDQENVTDESGRFKIKQAPAGAVMLWGMPKAPGGDLGFLNTVRTVDAAHPDVGDLPLVKSRVKRGEPVGELGVKFVQQPPGTPPDQRKLEVSHIDPDGPAAKTELEVGDVIASVDGLDVTGGGAMNAFTLMRAPPGTRIVLGLARGTKVSIVLAAP